MVFFTCNHCGESLKKQAVEKHYQWKSCKNGGVFVSCMDCMKDFRDQEYVAHTKCISEAEKYSGKDYVPKASANKGQRKQEAWTEMIEKVLSRTDLSQSVRSTLNVLTKHENVPRKRPKFANFMKNVSRSTSQVDVNKVFDLIEEAFKAEREEQEALKAKEKQNGAENGKDDLKRKQEEDEDKPTEEELPKKKKKKSKDAEEDQPEVTENGDSEDAPKDKKQKKKDKKAEDSNGTTAKVEKVAKIPEPQGFCWKETIRGIVSEKGNSISVNKLQTKLLKAYRKQDEGAKDEETVNENTIAVVLKRKLKKMKNISIEDDQVVIKV